MRKSCCLSEQRSTQSAWKQCGARHARLNRVTRTVAERFAQSTSVWPKTLPRGSNGGRSPLGLSFSTIFLQTKKDGATGGHWFSRAVGKKRAKKDMVPRSKCPWGAPGGPTEKRMPVKTRNKTITPPEVASRRARLVKRKNARLRPRRSLAMQSGQ